jgi:hypothetical protein
MSESNFVKPIPTGNFFIDTVFQTQGSFDLSKLDPATLEKALENHYETKVSRIRLIHEPGYEADSDEKTGIYHTKIVAKTKGGFNNRDTIFKETEGFLMGLLGTPIKHVSLNFEKELEEPPVSQSAP